MIAYHEGDLCLVPFPFTDLTTSKKRPALILACTRPKKLPPLYVVAMVTSQVESENIDGDCLLTSSKECGLLHPSKVRLTKLVTLEEKMIFSKLGSLVKKDKQGISKELSRVFKEWL
ncbi:MAG: type II toxin-antitoxin system PemK/MazF family toxin [Deltaproteobacteria bacterium]|nr:MAG: type II toxin-antitoxin system PemK/MazF family toxin [Deltaproteobacteria bacterium]